MVDDKTVKIKQSINSIAKKRDAAQGRRMKKRQDSTPAKELHREWVRSMGVTYPGVDVQKWGAQEMKLAWTFVRDVGSFDRAVDAIRHFISTWNDRRRDDCLPHFKLFWSLRERILAEIDGHVRSPMGLKERLGDGEFDYSRDNPDTVSWSDMIGSK